MALIVDDCFSCLLQYYPLNYGVGRVRLSHILRLSRPKPGIVIMNSLSFQLVNTWSPCSSTPIPASGEAGTEIGEGKRGYSDI